MKTKKKVPTISMLVLNQFIEWFCDSAFEKWHNPDGFLNFLRLFDKSITLGISFGGALILLIEWAATQ